MINQMEGQDLHHNEAKDHLPGKKAPSAGYEVASNLEHNDTQKVHGIFFLNNKLGISLKR